MKSKGGEPPEKRHFSLFPKPLSKTLAQVVKPVFKKHGFAEHRILTEWHLIVGEELAGYSLPQKLVAKRGQKDGGTLHVLVASARALEMQHLQPVICERIAAYFGHPAVSRLVFTQVSSLVFRKQPKPERQKTSTSGGAFAAAAESCEDEALRKALQSLGGALDAVEN